MNAIFRRTRDLAQSIAFASQALVAWLRRPKGLKKLLRVRRSIAVQLYGGLGAAVALTMGASGVAWIVFDQVGDAQRVVNAGSVPEMAAAFLVAQQVTTLVDMAPRLTIAETSDELALVRDDIAREQEIFEERLAALIQRRGQSEGVRRVRVWSRTLNDNIESLGTLVAERFEVESRMLDLGRELRVMDTALASILTTSLDDQYFYTMTGYEELGSDPAPRDLHFNEAQVVRLRRMADMREAAAIRRQLLESSFNLSDPDLLAAIQERHEAATSRIARSLGSLGEDRHSAEIASRVERMFELVAGGNGLFATRRRQLQIGQEQASLLTANRQIAADLVSEVQTVIRGLSSSTLVAARSSTDVIQTGRRMLLALNLVSIVGAVLIAWLFIGRYLLRRLDRISIWMRRMAGGDLETRIRVGGNDEVADMAAALDVFRRHALEVQRLNLVEKLADDLRSKNAELEVVLADLRKAQDQIVIREKLAALGELTAGVAHEIKNPLNFMSNFSEVSEELLEELQEILPEENDRMSADVCDEVQELCDDLTGNLECIRQHGERANRVVNDMLRMGRGSTDRQAVGISKLVSEHAQLAFHTARAADPDFQLHLEENYDEGVGELEVVPQDLGRVILNLVSNACHAVDEKRRESSKEYLPTLTLATVRQDDWVHIKVRDNGDGIPEEIRDKVFNPFFTTKPTDQGTGLGLSLSNDIVREHGGEIAVDSTPGEYTEMTISLPVSLGLDGDSPN